MSDDTRAAAKIRADQALRLAALTVLLERAGGRATFTEAEYEAIAARFGGRSSLVVRIEIVREGTKPPEVQVELLRKPAGNADLVS